MIKQSSRLTLTYSNTHAKSLSCSFTRTPVHTPPCNSIRESGRPDRIAWMWSSTRMSENEGFGCMMSESEECLEKNEQIHVKHLKIKNERKNEWMNHKIQNVDWQLKKIPHWWCAGCVFWRRFYYHFKTRETLKAGNFCRHCGFLCQRSTYREWKETKCRYRWVWSITRHCKR